VSFLVTRNSYSNLQVSFPIGDPAFTCYPPPLGYESLYSPLPSLAPLLLISSYLDWSYSLPRCLIQWSVCKKSGLMFLCFRFGFYIYRAKGMPDNSATRGVISSIFSGMINLGWVVHWSVIFELQIRRYISDRPLSLVRPWLGVILSIICQQRNWFLS